MSLNHRPLTNHLLAQLSEQDLEPFWMHLETLHLPRNYQIAAAGKPVTHYYFIEAGIASIVGSSPGGLKTELGLVGRDGVAPIPVMFGPHIATHQVLMQIGGQGHRVKSGAFSSILVQNAALRGLVLRYVQVSATQTVFTALSNAVHPLESRLARWLLMCHDRIDGDQIAITHDGISKQLAVRRPSVTTALHVLEGHRFIRARRGMLLIEDRNGLEQFAADCYGVPEAEYRRLIGSLRACPAVRA
jgi:CRP-like cAMP-binding protein